MAAVIERHGHDIDAEGFIHYDDRPSTYQRAEELAGRRLDRRRAYCIAEGEVRELARWSQACSGCYEGWDSAHGTGHGCRECGYTGRTRQAHWVPLTNNNED